MSNDEFAGAGAPPPPSARRSKFDKNKPEHAFFENVKDKEGKDRLRRISLWFLKRGENDRPCRMLDPRGKRFARLIHNFTGRDGRWGNKVVCIARAEPRGCDLCDVLGEEGKWHWCLTCIDESKWVIPDGKNKGKVWTNQRKLVLVTDNNLDDMRGLEDKGRDRGWRGRGFDVSRGSAQNSFKIGTSWYPSESLGVLSDGEMAERYADSAAQYGLPIEKFIAPFDYQTVLRTPSYEEMRKIANELRRHKNGGHDVTETVSAGGEEEVLDF